MIIIGTIWGIIAGAALIYGMISPVIERQDNQKRFKEYL